MKIVFMGTPDFAASSLKALISEGHSVSAVFTQPDKPVGRKRIITPPAVKVVALENNIEVYQPDSLKTGEAEKIILSKKPDVIVVVAYGKLIPESILNIAPCINVHGSLLPKYRGAAPIQWSVINGEKYGGVTTMFMDKGLDTGDIILTDKTEIKEGETSGELYERLAVIGANLLLKTLNLISNGKIERIRQNNDEATYAPMLSKEMAQIDFSKPANEVCSLICGLNPWPIAFTFYEGKRLKVFKAVSNKENGEAGTLISDKKLTIACKTGSVTLLEVGLEGSKIQSGEDFIRGHRLTRGSKLF